MLKPPTTYEQQIEKLRNRGCFIENEAFCTAVLKRLNYYRFSAYFLPFKTLEDSYISGTNFEDVYKIYEFDRKMRNVLFAALGEIEVSLRSRFAYFHAHEYGADGYMEEGNYNTKHNHQRFNEHIEAQKNQNRKVLFVRHHMENYKGKFPIWVIIELFTFGMLSYFYADLPTKDKKQIAKSLYNEVPQNIGSWLRCCTDLRNICAHYGRLYYRKFSAIPAGFAGVEDGKKRRLFGAILVVKALYPDKSRWKDSVLPQISELISEYRSAINLEHIGFVTNWQEILQE